MSTVKEIEQAILKLPPHELALLREWFATLEADRWDKQFEQDVAAGKLDWLAEEARRDLDAGRCTDL